MQRGSADASQTSPGMFRRRRVRAMPIPRASARRLSRGRARLDIPELGWYVGGVGALSVVYRIGSERATHYRGMIKSVTCHALWMTTMLNIAQVKRHLPIFYYIFETLTIFEDQHARYINR